MLNDRVREARTQLGLTQTEFGARFGVSVDVIKNIEYARTKPSELLLNHMCEIHHINRTWLETGEGDMFVPHAVATEEDIIRQLVADSDGNALILSIMQCWAELAPEQRAALNAFVDRMLDDYQRRKAEAANLKNREFVERGESDAPDTGQVQA